MKPTSKYPGIFLLLCLSILLCTMSTTVQAHKLRVFAWPEGNTVLGETAFSGGRNPKNAEVLVLNQADKTILLTTHTDDRGNFSFTLPQKALKEHLDLLLVVNSGEGHRGEWPLPAAEYAPDSTQSPETPSPPQSPVQDSARITPRTTAPGTALCSEQELRKIIDQELDKKLTPINYMLAQSSEHKPDLRDILGGIGYIIGLAGILAWAKAKKRRNDK